MYLTLLTPESSAGVGGGLIATVSSQVYTPPTFSGTTSCPNALLTASTTPSITLPSWQYRTQAGTYYGSCFSTGANTCNASLSCTTLVTAPPGYTVNFTVLSFDTEANADYFTWFDGATVNR